MKTSFIKCGLFVSLHLLAACAAPSEPAGLQSGGSGNLSPKNQKGKPGPQQGATVDYGGAAVGDADMREKVKACLDTGKFYERRSNPQPGCTTMALAEISCKDGTIKNIMTEEQKVQFDTLMGSTLSGYFLDQCLKCDSPAGNTYCEGSGSSKQSEPGVRLFLVKEGAGAIDIKTVYIRSVPNK